MQQLVSAINWWDFAAGLGLFLLGMMQTEQALRRLAGRRIKEFLRGHTEHPLESIASGVAATALLQSSSLVGLLTLAMVGAQVIALSNALGVVIGANLGTTLTGWVVATFGFRLDLGNIAMPMLAMGSVGMIVSNEDRQSSAWFRLLTAIGLLLFGLEFMKSSVVTEGLSLGSNPGDGSNPWLFLALGIAVTAIIQSSSAAMMITLAALHSGAITVLDGAAFVIGADLGTTSTVLLGAVKGNADKQRVGLAHFLFNLITDGLAFFLLLPVLPYLIDRFQLTEPLYVLVGFHSVFNLLGIIVFYPFLGAFARLLERFFTRRPSRLAPSLKASVIVDSASALAALGNEVTQLAQRVYRFNRILLDPEGDLSNATQRQQYNAIKALEAELLQFALGLHTQPLVEDESERLQALIAAARELVHSAKSMKDCHHDLVSMQESSTQAERHLYRDIIKLTDPLFAHAQQVMTDLDSTIKFEELVELGQLNHHNHEEIHRMVFQRLSAAERNWPTVSSILNANRELFIANIDFCRGIARLLVSPQQFDELESLPAAV